ncbi:hypothetical protein AMJ80_05085 [bacterium SM23_31]|nr:MAG: hypothetical protein AMJ80_05085 [bacterium SM23_31]
MRFFLALFIVFTAAFLSFAIYNYISKYGSLEGDVVFEFTTGSPDVASDSMYVFLISAQIETKLDSLEDDYNRMWAPLEDTVTYLREQVKVYTKHAQEEEVIFDLTYKDIVKRTELYRESKNYLDKVKAEKDSVDALFAEKLDRLITHQTRYNNKIAGWFNDKMQFKALVDKNGHFLFRKVPNEDYYIYALKIFAGNVDITNVPADMYYYYAFSGDAIRKYSWMFGITIKEDTYVTLDKSNMSQVFK